MSDHDQQELKRLRRLHQLGILDTSEDKMFSCLVDQALAIVPNSSIAAISLVDNNRQWFKAIKGLDIKQTPRSVSFCSHTIQTSGVMVVRDTLEDERFSENSLVTSGPKIRCYAGVKLMDGVGALCVIGSQPRQPTEAELGRLVKLAQFVDIQLLAHGTHFNLERPAQNG